MTGNGILSPIARAFSQFNAFITLKIEDAKVIEGIVWSLRKRFTVAKSTSVDIIMDPTGFTGSVLVFQPLGYSALGGPFNIDIYRGATADNDGTLIRPYNKDLSIVANGEVIFRQTPSNIVTGTDKFMELFVPSDGTGAVATSGTTGGDSIVSKIDPTKKYLIRITNTDTVDDGIVGLVTDHFEVR